MPRVFQLPDLGEGIAEAQIVRVLVSEGDEVKEDQTLMEVETDKAAVEIPSPFSGKAVKVHVEAGQTVKVGVPLVSFGDAEAGATAAPAAKPAAPSAKPAAARAEPASPAPAAPPAAATGAPRARAEPAKAVAAAPAVRKLARELGVDIQSVTGSGPGERVLREDVEKAARGGTAQRTPVWTEVPMPARPTAPPPPVGRAEMDKWGPTRRAPLSQIRKTIANQMVRSVQTIPHVTHTDDADITELDRLRRGYAPAPGEPPRKLTLMPFVIQAITRALRSFPEMNSSFDHEAGEIVYKDYVSIGVAVDTERGLIVPVIRNTDQMSILHLADALAVMAEKVRKVQFAIEELRGGTFTITNVGALGGRYSTPIINYPEVAILGLGRSRMEPVVVEDKIVPRLMLPLCVSFDHRVTDGAQAARFTREVVTYLENPVRLLL